MMFRRWLATLLCLALLSCSALADDTALIIEEIAEPTLEPTVEPVSQSTPEPTDAVSVQITDEPSVEPTDMPLPSVEPTDAVLARQTAIPPFEPAPSLSASEWEGFERGVSLSLDGVCPIPGATVEGAEVRYIFYFAPEDASDFAMQGDSFRFTAAGACFVLAKVTDELGAWHVYASEIVSMSREAMAAEAVKSLISLLYKENLTTDREKSEWLHDCLAKTVKPDEAAESDAYAALVEGKSDSEGCAKAYALLLDELKIENKLVEVDSEFWNALLLDGEWVNVDVWRDAQPSPSHDFLFLSDEEMACLRAGEAPSESNEILSMLSVSAAGAALPAIELPESIELSPEETAELLSSEAGEGILWSSSDEAVAVVESGIVTAIAPGFATVTAENGETSAICRVTVITDQVTAVIPAQYGITIGLNDTVSVANCAIEPTYARTTLTYASSKTSVATVTADGRVRAIRKGSAYIYIASASGAYTRITVNVVKAPTSVSLKAARTVVGVGETLSAYPSVPSGSAASFTYFSNNESVATIDANGKFTAHSPGIATLMARAYNGKVGYLNITVVPKPESVSFNADRLKLSVGQTAYASYALNSGAVGSVHFSSDDDTVVTVNRDTGLLTAVGTGSAVVTVETYNHVQAQCDVTVVAAPETVTLIAPRSTLGVGEAVQLSTVFDSEDTCASLAYSSSKPKIVSVYANGVIIAKKTGSAWIKVITHNGKQCQIPIKVVKAPKSVTLYLTRNIMGVNETLPTGFSLTKNTASGLRWFSSAPDVVSVDEYGNLTAHQVGCATISIYTFNNKVNRKNVYVVAEPTEVNFNTKELRLGVGQQSAVGYSLNAGAVGTVSYSGNEDSVIRVDRATGLITAVGEGTAQITIETYNHITDTCTVTVVPAPETVTLTAPRQILGVGESVQLSAAFESEEVCASLAYSSSKPKIVSVNANGVITAKKTGSAWITVVTHNGKKCQIPIKVIKAPKSVTLYLTRNIMGVNETLPTGSSLTKNTASGLRWFSSAPDIVSVDEYGNLTAHQIGCATISIYTFNNKVNRKNVYVVAEPTEVNFNTKELRLGVGQQSAVGYSLNAGAVGTVSYSGNEDSVIRVDRATGLITAVGEGTAEITIETYNHITDTCTVTVVPAPETVTLTAERQILGKGESIQLTPVFGPEDSMASVAYATSKSKVAVVSPSGIVTAKGTGTAVITVRTHNGRFAQLAIAVKKAPTSVKLYASRNVLGVDETAQLTAVASSGSASGSRFYSSNSSVVSVEPNGRITAVAEGSALLTVYTFNNKRASLWIAVCSKPESVQLTVPDSILGVDQYQNISAAVNSGAAGQLTASSDKPDVLYVDPATGCMRGISVGTAHVIVTAYNGASASAEIEVRPAPEAVWFDTAAVYIGLGDTVALEPRITEGAESAFAWASGSTKYVTVNGNGLVYGKKIGSSVITVRTHNNKYAQIRVYVQKAPTAIAVNPSAVTLGVGEQHQLIPFCNSGAVTTMRYQSVNPGIAQVSADGIITAVAAGTTQIVITSHNGKRCQCAVTVLEAPSSVSLIAPEVMGERQTVRLFAELPEGTYSPLHYSLVSGDAVQISAGGEVTAVGQGIARVRVSTYLEDVFDEADIEVRPAPATLTLDQEAYVTDIDVPFTAVATVEEGAYGALQFLSSNPAVFTVDASGNVTPVVRGTATLTVSTYNGLAVSAPVTIIDPYYPETLVIEGIPSDMNVGGVTAPAVSFLPETAVPALVWSSSDEQVLTVDPATGAMTARTYGRSLVTAASQRYPEIVQTFLVTVSNGSHCLVMPQRRTDVSGISANLARISAVESSAYESLRELYEGGVISSADYQKRRSIVSAAFDMYAFPWMTLGYQRYWKAANSENGAKDFKPGIVYYGLPYINAPSANRCYNVARALSEYRYYDSGEGYYILNQGRLLNGLYVGNDCSAFCSMAIWGLGTSYSALKTGAIATSSVYKTVRNTNDLRAGDLLCRADEHVIMFLYYANVEKTRMVIIEQGGSEAAINCCSCSVQEISKYIGHGYQIRRLASLG